MSVASVLIVSAEAKKIGSRGYFLDPIPSYGKAEAKPCEEYLA